MQITNASDKKITSIIDILNNFDFDVLYFADSLGNLDINQTKKIVKKFKKVKPIGIHAHNNKGLAMVILSRKRCFMDR